MPCRHWGPFESPLQDYKLLFLNFNYPPSNADLATRSLSKYEFLYLLVWLLLVYVGLRWHASGTSCHSVWSLQAGLRLSEVSIDFPRAAFEFSLPRGGKWGGAGWRWEAESEKKFLDDTFQKFFWDLTHGGRLYLGFASQGQREAVRGNAGLLRICRCTLIKVRLQFNSRETFKSPHFVSHAVESLAAPAGVKHLRIAVETRSAKPLEGYHHVLHQRGGRERGEAKTGPEPWGLQAWTACFWVTPQTMGSKLSSWTSDLDAAFVFLCRISTYQKAWCICVNLDPHMQKENMHPGVTVPDGCRRY